MKAALTPPPPARPGNALHQVSTPALLLDLDALASNVIAMADWARKNQVALRPNAKAHKSVAIAQAQIAQGAVGICCQKLSEAYPFAAAGIQDILISNQFVGQSKVAMAMELAAHVDLSVCVDHPAQVAALGLAAKASGTRLTVLAEVDVGQGRCGVSHADDLMRLVEAIAQHDALRFGGIQAYHGGAQHIASWAERRTVAQGAADIAASYLLHLERRGIRCVTVTGSGTGCAEFDAARGIYTELQPGSYVFMDRHYESLEWQGELRFKNSLFIASTIMSTAQKGRAICDVGLKGLAVDAGMPRVHAPSDLQYLAANDEHGILHITQHPERDRLGEQILLVPGHCDPTVNLYAQYVGYRHDTVKCLWPIDARGYSQ